MHATRWLIAAGLALTLAGCAGEDFSEGTPDVEGLALELAGGGAESLALSAPTITPDDLAEARARIAALNRTVRAVLEPVAALVKEQAQDPSADVRVYGPADLPAASPVATFQLTVRKIRERRYGWRLDARPLADAAAPWKPVLAGALTLGYAPHRGSGILGVSLVALNAVNPVAFPGSGYLVAAFAHREGGAKTLVYGLRDFDPQGTGQAANAVFAGHRTAAGVRRVRVMAISDRILDTPDPELVLSHLGWVPGLGGRGFVVVSGWLDGGGAYHGDVPQGSYWLGYGCWDAVAAEGFKEWRLCSTGPVACLADPGTIQMTQGSPSACVPGTEVAPPADPTQVDGPTDGAPDVPPALPAQVPTDIPAS